MFKKLLAAMGALALAGGLVAVVASPAYAHTPTISASCQSGLSVHLVDYSNFDTDPNTIKVVVDGVTKTDGTFGDSFSQTYPFAGGQDSYTYEILVHAADNEQYTFDTGVVSVTDCATSVTPAEPTKTDATCASGGTTGSGGYTIPADQPGVQYELFDAVTNSWRAVGSGTYPAAVASVVKIEAIAATTGYKLTGTTSWTFEIAAPPSDCVSDSIAVAPTFTPAICSTVTPGQSTPNSYTIHATSGAHFQVKIGSGAFVDTLPGTYGLGSGVSTVTIQALPDAHFQLSGQTTFSYDFPAAPACLTTVVPNAGSTAAVCDTAHPGQQTPGSFTLDAVTGVIYTVSTNGGASQVTTAGTHQVSNGTDIRVLATADAAHGYRVDGSPSWHFTFASAGDCLQDAKWVKPVATSESCLPDGSAGGGLGQLGGSVGANHLTTAFITIPSTTGVQYAINGVVHAAGDVVLAPDTYTVTAAALTGYQLAADYPVGGWIEVLTSAQACGGLPTHPLVDPSATQVQLQCFAGGSYTLSNNLSDPAAITWTVNGSTVEQGTYKLAATGTVTVHAVANGPAYGLEQGATQDWTFTFSAPANCDLKTLALTGSTPLGWIVFGYLLLISGLVLVAIRNVRRRPQQE